jgi:hypothetical protein
MDLVLTYLLGFMQTLKRDFMAEYFFHIAIANRGWIFGIANKAFNLNADSRITN